MLYCFTFHHLYLLSVLKKFKQFPGASQDSSFDVTAIHDNSNCNSPSMNDISCDGWSCCGNPELRPLLHILVESSCLQEITVYDTLV